MKTIIWTENHTRTTVERYQALAARTERLLSIARTHGEPVILPARLSKRIADRSTTPGVIAAADSALASGITAAEKDAEELIRARKEQSELLMTADAAIEEYVATVVA